MARGEDSDFLKRLFDEPAGGKSPNSRPSKRSRRAESRARLLAELEAAGERLEEGIVLDDSLLAGYLDGALGKEEHVALEGLLARSADLRDQLAAAAGAREAALASGAKMPKAYIEDFDAVPPPRAGTPAERPGARRATIALRWLASLAPGRRWAMAALPAIVVVVIVAVIGPGVYGPRQAVSPPAVVGATVADKDMKNDLRRRSKPVERRKASPAGAAASRPQKRAPGGLADTGGRRGGGPADRVVSSTVVPLDDDLRAALIRLGLRQNRRLYAPGSISGRPDLKKKAVKPAAPKRPAKIAEEPRQRAAKPKTKAESPAPRADLEAREAYPRGRRSAIDGAIEKCNRRRVDPKLLRRLQAGGPPLENIKVLRLSSKSCLFTLPDAPAGQ